MNRYIERTSTCTSGTYLFSTFSSFSSRRARVGGRWKVEGGRWEVDFLHVKERNLGEKRANKHWSNRREREDGWQKKKMMMMKEKIIFFPREFIHLGVFSFFFFFFFFFLFFFFCPRRGCCCCWSISKQFSCSKV